ncbi:hypothetical protein SJAV_05420 [Sulfurisphaera javensis]|uniref:Uncharacterized protein n=1 Tax=Sulfurisphaera javensis TaxID=2049879 RepID=A0AAT9GNX6_9CREN
MNRNSLFIVVGVLLIVIFLSVYILTPVYLPYYKVVDKALENNYTIVEVPPSKTIKVLTINTTESNNTIYLIANTSSVYLQVINSSGLVANSSEVLITKVYPGTYYIAIANPTNTYQYVTLRHAIFTYDEINSLYSTLGVITTISEFFIALGVVAAGYGLIASFFGKRFKRKK